MGTIKTTNIQSITGSGTVTIGQSGETITVPSGATLDLSNATQTGVGGTMTPAFSVTNSTNQSITDSTFTTVQFNTENYDTDSAFDTSNYKFTVPSGQAGKYHFDTTVGINPDSTYTGSGNQFQVTIRHYNSSDTEQSRVSSRTNFNYIIYPNTSISGDFDMSVGDYVLVQLYLTAGGYTTLYGNTYTKFTGYKIIE